MIFCKELKKEFTSKAEMFVELKANKETIIGLKKASLKDTDWALISVIGKEDASKAEGVNSGEIKMGDYIYPVINTTNYMDSHGDVHIDGIWDVSVKDQKNKLYYIINHELEIGKVIGYPEDVEAMVKGMSWTELGRDYPGSTQALIYKVLLTEKGNKDALQAIMNKVALQNSVRMQYVRMKLCINDQSEYSKEEYANWLQYFPVVANSDVALEYGYFWAVLEAKIYKEGSAVLAGSNDVTPILTAINEEKQNPLQSSSTEIKESPSADSLSSNKKQTIYALI